MFSDVYLSILIEEDSVKELFLIYFCLKKRVSDLKHYRWIKNIYDVLTSSFSS